MALDPKLFDAAATALGLARWPGDGEAILYRRRGEQEWTAATVERVWGGIEVMIDLRDDRAICPALGDEFTLGDT